METLTPQIREQLRYAIPGGERKVFDAEEVTRKGTQDAVEFIESAVQNRNTPFDRDLINGIHGELFYFLPEAIGRLRPENTALDENGEPIKDQIGYGKNEGDRIVQKWIPLTPGGKNLEERMKIYSSWLNTEVERIKHVPDNLIDGLHTACEAHYIFTSPEFHPFVDGNGRVARLLLNSILMLNAHELMYYGIKILPVPLLRQKSQKNIASIDDWKEDSYLAALRVANETNDLTQLEVLIAEKWSGNIAQMLNQMEQLQSRPRVRTADKNLIAIFHKRKDILDEFVQEHGTQYWQKCYSTTNACDKVI